MAATEQTLQFKFADGSVISGDEFIAKSSFVESEDVPVSTLKGQESDSEEEETPSGKETEETSYSETTDSKTQSKASKEIKKNDEAFKKKPVEEVEPRDDDFTDTAQATSTSSSSSPPVEEVTPTEATSTTEGTSNLTFSVSVTNVGSSSAGQLIIGGGGNNSSITQSDPEQHLEVERFGSSLDGDSDVQLNYNSGLEIYGEDPLLFTDSLNSKNLVLQNDANINDIAAIYVENMPDGWGVAGGANEGDGSWLLPSLTNFILTYPTETDSQVVDLSFKLVLKDGSENEYVIPVIRRDASDPGELTLSSSELSPWYWIPAQPATI